VKYDDSSENLPSSRKRKSEYVNLMFDDEDTISVP
jgi:hypothetical protein